MFFYLREVIGWVLVAVSLVLIPTVLSYVANRQVIEGAIVAFICSLLLRSGIHLVRVSTAARLSVAKRPATSDSASFPP